MIYSSIEFNLAIVNIALGIILLRSSQAIFKCHIKIRRGLPYGNKDIILTDHDYITRY